MFRQLFERSIQFETIQIKSEFSQQLGAVVWGVVFATTMIARLMVQLPT